MASIANGGSQSEEISSSEATVINKLLSIRLFRNDCSWIRALFLADDHSLFLAGIRLNPSAVILKIRAKIVAIIIGVETVPIKKTESAKVQNVPPNSIVPRKRLLVLIGLQNALFVST